MGKPYSVDLRRRVVAAIEAGMSRNRAATQFGIAISTAIGWMQRVEQTGSVAPGQMGGHKPKAISGEHAVWLSQRIRAGDFTLRGLVVELGEQKLFYLPKYSPDLNPIEQVFAKLKHLIRKAAARTIDAVCAAIGEALPAFTPEECANYLKNSGYRT